MICLVVGNLFLHSVILRICSSVFLQNCICVCTKSGHTWFRQLKTIGPASDSQTLIPVIPRSIFTHFITSYTFLYFPKLHTKQQETWVKTLFCVCTVPSTAGSQSWLRPLNATVMQKILWTQLVNYFLHFPFLLFLCIFLWHVLHVNGIWLFLCTQFSFCVRISLFCNDCNVHAKEVRLTERVTCIWILPSRLWGGD